MAWWGQQPGQPAGQSQSPDSAGRFRLARQATLFLLGVVVMLDGIFSSSKPGLEVVAGLVLLGLVPIDDLMSRLPRPTLVSPPPEHIPPPSDTHPPTQGATHATDQGR